MNATGSDAPSRGRFITFEGPDGSGKSTQIRRLAAWFETLGVPVTLTREPGGSPGADAIRHIVLSGAAEDMGVETEALLFAAARYDHVRSVIAPALQRDAFVLCDRFLDSTRAYQGSVPGLDQAFLSEVEAATTPGVRPDLTLILDVPSDVSLKRLSQRRSAEAADRFEKDGDEVFKARRQAFLDIAAREPDRCVVIAASGSVDGIGARIEGIVLDRFGDEIARLRRTGLESAR